MAEPGDLEAQVRLEARDDGVGHPFAVVCHRSRAVISDAVADVVEKDELAVEAFEGADSEVTAAAEAADGGLAVVDAVQKRGDDARLMDGVARCGHASRLSAGGAAGVGCGAQLPRSRRSVDSRRDRETAHCDRARQLQGVGIGAACS